VPQDSQKSRELFEVAAEKGNSASMVNLGFFYERGKGVQQDYMKAVNYYRVGGEKGNTGGLYNLAGNSPLPLSVYNFWWRCGVCECGC